MKGQIVINQELCKECDLCIISCKQGLIVKSTGYNSKGYVAAEFKDDKKKCNACRMCALVCPEVAIEVYGE